MDLELTIIENNNLDGLEQPNPYQLGQATYYKNDYSFEYVTNYYKSNRFSINIFQIIQDTFTLIFEITSKKFIAFDDYTNKDMWTIQDNLTLPKDYGKGQLIIEKEFERDDRYSFREKVNYFYSKEGILKITLTDEELTPVFYEISSNLIVGMYNKRVVSLYLNKINFELFPSIGFEILSR